MGRRRYGIISAFGIWPGLYRRAIIFYRCGSFRNHAASFKIDTDPQWERRMAKYKFKKGLDLPITGAPAQVIEAGQIPARIALLADDYVGMKPSFHVQTGDTVKPRPGPL